MFVRFGFGALVWSVLGLFVRFGFGLGGSDLCFPLVGIGFDAPSGLVSGLALVCFGADFDGNVGLGLDLLFARVCDRPLLVGASFVVLLVGFALDCLLVTACLAL